jgi:hypothetical protein
MILFELVDKVGEVVFFALGVWALVSWLVMPKPIVDEVRLP